MATKYLGMGVMIHMLGGGSKHSASEYYGKTITSSTLKDNRLLLSFADGKKIAIWDDGQSCCESRYINCDDDPTSLVGGVLSAINVKDAPNEPDEYGEHEVCFIEVQTDKGSITLATHVEHNGYYGGFGLTITEEGE